MQRLSMRNTGIRGYLSVAAIVLVAIALLILLLHRVSTAQTAVAKLPVSPLVGHTAPDFTIQTWTLDGSPGQTVHLAALKGHPVVVNFWASWCEACKTE